MKFSTLVDYLGQLEATSKRLEMTRILGELFKTAAGSVPPMAGEEWAKAASGRAGHANRRSRLHRSAEEP